MSSPEVQRGIVYSVQDERLDPLKRESSSVYIVESDNDFFFGVIQASKQFSQCFTFFFSLLLLCAAQCVQVMYARMHHVLYRKSYTEGITSYRIRIYQIYVQNLN